MEKFEIIAGVASIFSLLVGIFIAKQVCNIKNNITMKSSQKTKVKQSAEGGNITQAGRDING